MGIALGASSLGRGDGDSPSASSVDLAIRMLTAGFPVIDTANGYTGGASERALGAAVRELGGVPSGVTIVSKADADPDTGRFDGERVRVSLEESLERLGLEHLPLYHLHDPHGLAATTAAGAGGAVEALFALRSAGRIGAVGIATGPLSELADYLGLGDFDAMLTHNRYTLADRAAEPLLRAAGGAGMTVFNAAPFGGGLLADDAGTRRNYAYRPAGEELLGWLERVRALCAGAGVPLAAVALRFAAAHPAVTHVVVGISSPRRLEELGTLVDTEVPAGLLTAIDALGPPPPRASD